ncbi:MAG: AI-2E family transporter [Candidatus Thiothrix sulfatifontis]|nr:MAG: AI-2E family transporter [Candidatus Thiothrix sulfatifontis]
MEGNAANTLKIPAWGIFIISMGVVLYVAKAILIPMTLAVIASFLLTPAVNYLQKFRIPSTVSSFLILLLFFTLLLTAINYLADPVSVWVERLPAELRYMEGKLILFKSAITDMWAMTDRSATIMVAGNNPPMHDVMVGGSNILFTLLDNTQSFLVSIISFALLLYFLLAFGDSIINSANRYWGSQESSAMVIRIVTTAQQQVGHYLLLITAINVSLGVLVALTMWGLGMPNPIVWGASATILNYIPYVGVAINIVIITLVSSLTFNHIGQILLPPLVLVLLNLLEEFVLPLFVGKVFTINPILIFLFILFLGWLWGMAGIFMAVPLLMIIKIVFDQTQAREIV